MDVPPVTPTTFLPSKARGVVKIGRVLDLDRRRADDPAQARQLLRVRAGPAADDDHEIDLSGRLDRVLLAPDRHRADRVDDLQLVAPAHHERGELLELPGRLGRLGDQGHPLLARDLRLPLLFLVDDDRIGREAEEADDLGVVRGPEQDDRVALVDELEELLLLLDDPGAGPVDDLEAAGVGPLHDVGPDAVGADDDRRAVIDVVERLDRPDAHRLEVCDDALVVDDLAQGMRQLAGGRRLLGLVDRLAHAIAEAGALRDPDRFDGSHLTVKYRMGPRIDPAARRDSFPNAHPTGTSEDETLNRPQNLPPVSRFRRSVSLRGLIP